MSSFGSRRKSPISDYGPAHDEAIQSHDDFDVTEWLVETRELLTDLQFTLESDPPAGRHILRRLLVGPITIAPRQTEAGLAFEYSGQGALNRLLTGEVPAGVTKPNTTMLVPPG